MAPGSGNNKTKKGPGEKSVGGEIEEVVIKTAPESETLTGKAARNRRKKENAKKAKLDAAEKVKEEEEFFASSAGDVDATAGLATLTVKPTSIGNVKGKKDDTEEGNRKGLGKEKGKGKGKSVDSSIANTGDHSTPQIKIFTISHSTGKGLGLFVTQDVKKGDLILIEASLLPDTLGTTWLGKHASFKIASLVKQARFLALDSTCNCPSFTGHCYETEFMKHWHSNSFIASQPNETPCTLVFENASRVNHSCDPNAAFTFTAKKHMVIRAIRDLAAGEEVTFNYYAMAGTTAERRDALSKLYKFVCECALCQGDVSISDEEYAVIIRNSLVNPDHKRSDPSILNLASGDEKVVAISVILWLHTLASSLPAFKEKVRGILHNRLAEEGVVVGNTFNRSVVQAGLNLWIFSDVRENNPFGLSEDVLAFAFLDRFWTWEEKYKKFGALNGEQSIELLLDVICEGILG